MVADRTYALMGWGSKRNARPGFHSVGPLFFRYRVLVRALLRARVDCESGLQGLAGVILRKREKRSEENYECGVHSQWDRCAAVAVLFDVRAAETREVLAGL